MLKTLIMFWEGHWGLDGCLFRRKGITPPLGVPLGSIQSQS